MLLRHAWTRPMIVEAEYKGKVIWKNNLHLRPSSLSRQKEDWIGTYLSHMYLSYLNHPNSKIGYPVCDSAPGPCVSYINTVGAFSISGGKNFVKFAKEPSNNCIVHCLSPYSLAIAKYMRLSGLLEKITWGREYSSAVQWLPGKHGVLSSVLSANKNFFSLAIPGGWEVHHGAATSDGDRTHGEKLVDNLDMKEKPEKAQEGKLAL